MTVRLDDPVDVVDGVGPRTASTLRDALGIVTVRDLVEHYPRRYDDLGEVVDLSQVRIGDTATLVGTVTSWNHRRIQRPRRRTLQISEAEVDTVGGGRFRLTFFNQQWRERSLRVGTLGAFSGKIESYKGTLKITMPEIQVLGGDGEGDVDHRRLLPVYPATEKTPTWKLGRWITAALEALEEVDDYLPAGLRDHHGLLALDDAMRAIHLPEDRDEARAARTRLVFDELFTLQIGLQWRRARLEADLAGLDNGPVDEGWAQRYLASLPFAPTGAQERAFDEIGADLAGERPMHRLLQGDVGAGKTLVAVWSMLCAVDHGRQAALMVPTEVLAEQHYRTLTEQLAPLGVNVLDGLRVELLTSSSTTSQRRRILGELLSGQVDLVVGTHALLEEGVRFADLGLVVIDEQHRFGVAQRIKLKEKGSDASGAGRPVMPDVLVMTATPIPRSLALTVYGDLEVTVLDEMPPGRKPIVTQLITPDQAERRHRLEAFIAEQAAAGYQAYVVCPLVEESEELAARSATEEHARLSAALPDLRVGLVHGRLRPDDKEAAMTAFRSGETDVLVATTVIEVGVDVPNATVMVIEDAERFGISQLHQLRGRVGRGGERSYCVLFAGWSGDELSEEAAQRLEAVATTLDGFDLAEKDLEIRGEGQLFGQRQSGMPDLKLARLRRDMTLIKRTREAAQRLIAGDPHLTDPAHATVRAEVVRRYRGGLEELEALASG